MRKARLQLGWLAALGSTYGVDEALFAFEDVADGLGPLDSARFVELVILVVCAAEGDDHLAAVLGEAGRDVLVVRRLGLAVVRMFVAAAASDRVNSNQSFLTRAWAA